MIKLSILIPFIPEHERHLESLLIQLKKQRTETIEVLTLGGLAHKDGGKSTGGKRNDLIDQSRGEYITFIDADDVIAPNYIERILSGLNGCDVLVYDVMYSNKAGFKKVVKYSKDFKKDAEKESHFERLPNHLMVIKRDLAHKVKFKNVTFGEDADFAKRLLPHLQSECVINEVLYYYLDMK